MLIMLSNTAPLYFFCNAGDGSQAVSQTLAHARCFKGITPMQREYFVLLQDLKYAKLVCKNWLTCSHSYFPSQIEIDFIPTIP